LKTKLTDLEMREIKEYLDTAGCECGPKATILWRIEGHALIAMCSTCTKTVVMESE
jgi:hypothetical protein